MRWLVCLGSLLTFTTVISPANAQLPPAAALEPEEELRAIPDEPPTTPAVLPAVYRRFYKKIGTVPQYQARKPAPPRDQPFIPAGKFGLQLSDGTRLIGQPGQNWSLHLKTNFGTSTVPLSQVDTVVSKNAGTVVVHLTNGDRLTGRLLANTIPYVTQFGTLTVPSSALVALQRGGRRMTRQPGQVGHDPAGQSGGRPLSPPHSGVSYPTPAPPPPSPSPFSSSAVPIRDASVIREIIIRR